MLSNTRGIENLREAEFKMHEICFKNYTQVVPAKRSRPKTTEVYTPPENKDAVGGYAMRKRLKVDYTEEMPVEADGNLENFMEECSTPPIDDGEQTSQIVQTEESDKDYIPSDTSITANVEPIVDCIGDDHDEEETLSLIHI